MTVSPKLSVPEARERLTAIIDQVRADHTPACLARRGRRVAAVKADLGLA
ncbi:MULTISPECIES: type II toxin-antitoxin system prevent-host-death family antitoxin [unclassified Frankia]